MPARTWAPGGQWASEPLPRIRAVRRSRFDSAPSTSLSPRFLLPSPSGLGMQTPGGRVPMSEPRAGTPQMLSRWRCSSRWEQACVGGSRRGQPLPAPSTGLVVVREWLGVGLVCKPEDQRVPTCLLACPREEGSSPRPRAAPAMGLAGAGGGHKAAGKPPSPSRGSQGCGSAGPGAAPRHPAARPSLAPLGRSIALEI